MDPLVKWQLMQFRGPVLIHKLWFDIRIGFPFKTFSCDFHTVLTQRALDRSAVWDYVLHYMLCILWYGLILLAVKMGPTTSPKNGIAVLKHDDEPKGRRFGRVCL